MPLQPAAQCHLHTVCPTALTSLVVNTVAAAVHAPGDNNNTNTNHSAEDAAKRAQALKEHTHHTTWRGCRSAHVFLAESSSTTSHFAFSCLNVFNIMPLSAVAQCVLHTVCPSVLATMVVAGVSHTLQHHAIHDPELRHEHAKEHMLHTTWRGCR
ncbi:hypothetical protein SDRG_00956 [Saprolegnia diclina VS20]|uniref:Uncharacterized protein n=1 Tax=Saprolegnia diclina (strain VS20) TaxID=1156394 RepID=T0R592_SAPDV|nr:hypothetical protein SDRG_00956 [Saprolegnia diclina VS20]EQC42116.1 hypothetical protein SDRG_00956 [Saprolegnia diclina VS20]|eukprot:XP_008604685.1 hypothetical protein SDRG_00956 [Saprolegnia diclina VS20]